MKKIIFPPGTEADIKKLSKQKPIKIISAKKFEKQLAEKLASFKKPIKAGPKKKKTAPTIVVPTPPLKPNWIIWSFVRAPYTQSIPNPEVVINETETISGENFAVMEELDNARTGVINLGILGGNWYTEDFSLLLASTPMTATWTFGDATVATAKFVQTIPAVSLSFVHSLFVYVTFSTNSDNSGIFGADYHENILAI